MLCEPVNHLWFDTPRSPRRSDCFCRLDALGVSGRRLAVTDYRRAVAKLCVVETFECIFVEFVPEGCLSEVVEATRQTPCYLRTD